MNQSENQPRTQRRSKCFDETHQKIVKTAVRLISEKGVDALSVTAVARELGINRTTVYYHFENREKLIKAVKEWSSEQLTKPFGLMTSQAQRIDYTTGFVLDNPELMKLWIDDFISEGDIRNSYPHWDRLVNGLKAHFEAEVPDKKIDVEVFCVMLLTAGLIGPRVLKNSVCPNEDIATLKKRFSEERKRLLTEGAYLANFFES